MYHIIYVYDIQNLFSSHMLIMAKVAIYGALLKLTF